MLRRLTSVGAARPLLDIASYARHGPGRRDRLSLEEIELIARTVRRTPEVMVKVLSRGGQNVKAVGRHLAYLNRGGEVQIETDDGQHLSGKGVEQELLGTWNSIGGGPNLSRGPVDRPPSWFTSSCSRCRREHRQTRFWQR